ncbi:Hypothetical predicted protein [Mytilus galloprovincialis]|uniref:Uncharacterized protein n=1 Tax=Mytilus galloprovincialis TaxID=29158 RepID=A0A8B6EN66_MYTGA|nr:Hypothetical predicted protein [Mytilus galloprovincialis]
MASVQMSTQTNGLSAYTHTKVFTPASRTNVTIMTTKSSSLEFTKASVMSSTETGENTEHTGTMKNNFVGQFDNTTVMPDEHLRQPCPIQTACILKCTNSCANRTVDASTNVPYKVNRKLLSSYRNTHCSANDTRKSSFYIGCIDCTDPNEDCLRLRLNGELCDQTCATSYLTICQRDADPETTSVIDSTSSPEITTTHSKTSIVPITTEADLLQTTSYISITSSHEITTTNPKTTEGRTATETDLFGTTSAHLSTKTETTVESSTSNSAKSLAPKVSSTLSSGIVTNSTEHCNYVFVCSNHVNKIQDSQRFIYTVDTKQLSSYKRKRQSAWDPRKSSLYIGTVGIAVLVLTILLIMFLDCVPTKV